MFLAIKGICLNLRFLHKVPHWSYLTTKTQASKIWRLTVTERAMSLHLLPHTYSPFLHHPLLLHSSRIKSPHHHPLPHQHHPLLNSVVKPLAVHWLDRQFKDLILNELQLTRILLLFFILCLKMF
jgi:hypothetical protein